MHFVFTRSCYKYNEYQHLARGTLCLYLGSFSCGLWPPREFTGFFGRELASTGTLPAETSRHRNSREVLDGKTSRGNWPPHETLPVGTITGDHS